MKWKHALMAADIAFLLLLILMFAGMLFIAGDAADFGINAGILCVAMALAIFTYFTTLTAGLAANIILIFGFVSYVIYMSLTKGAPVMGYTYFWVVWTPLFTGCVAVFGQQSGKMHESLEDMDRQIREFAPVDSETGLKNLRAFEKEAYVYMRIAVRYGMHLTLYVFELRYQKELEHILGRSRMKELKKQISDTIGASLRAEDAVYLLKDQPVRWGALLFTNGPARELVMERVRKNIQEIKLRDDAGRRPVSFEMRVGAAEFTPEIASSLQFLEHAIKQMEFDV